jgi:hypothetical protein
LSWFSLLHQFDTWDIDKNAPLNSGEEPDVIRQAPQPDMEILLTFSKLRLLQGLDQGDPAAALKDVRVLAQLLMTQDSEWGLSLALNLLNIEEIFIRGIDPKIRSTLSWSIVPD